MGTGASSCLTVWALRHSVVASVALWWPLRCLELVWAVVLSAEAPFSPFLFLVCFSGRPAMIPWAAWDPFFKTKNFFLFFLIKAITADGDCSHKIRR